MRLLRRFGEAMVLLLSVAGIIGCAGGIIGIWMSYPVVSEKVQNISDRLDAGLERVSAANQNVGHALQRARAEMAAVSKESVDLEGGGEKGGRTARMLRTVIQQRARNIDELGGRLATLSDAAVAVSSLLESLQELPNGPSVRAEPESLQRRAEETRQLSARLRKLEAALSDGEKGADSREFAAATSEVDDVLGKCQLAAEGWQSDLDAARQDLERLTTQVESWQVYAAVAMTVLLVWVAAGQISLFGRALEWLRRA